MQIVEIMEKTFQAESSDVALYLAMSKKAADEGDSETARYLYDVAMDEAHHAADFAILLGKVKDTRSNISRMLEDEIISEKERGQGAKIAFAEGNKEAYQYFETSMRDEKRHKTVLKAILSRLGEKD